MENNQENGKETYTYTFSLVLRPMRTKESDLEYIQEMEEEVERLKEIPWVYQVSVSQQLNSYKKLIIVSLCEIVNIYPPTQNRDKLIQQTEFLKNFMKEKSESHDIHFDWIFVLDTLRLHEWKTRTK